MILASINTFYGIRDILDICLVVILFFFIYKLVKGTAARSIFVGFIVIYIFWKIVSLLNMKYLSELLGGFISVGFIAMIIIFQPEIRRFLNILGSKILTKRIYKWLLRKSTPNNTFKFNSTALVQACGHMSHSFCGALIVICRYDKLENIITTGEAFDSQINAQLIETIFFKNTPLHDGALIIDDNKIKAARCILPVSHSKEIPVNFGLRHRSAIGVTEDTDAVAVIVSEQTGSIAIVEKGSIEANVSLIRLQEYLDSTFNSVSVSK
ncbi:MAG: diadenylate cyclase CdaA [Bacteroidales bacterium]|jgi:uncharacterized protein (TIGR00159 family)|nr:diadenylate cyclase CdaA [Bacteroidales bacterium]